MKPRSLVPKGGNDRVYTPDGLAARIVAHFKPGGTILEPCRGEGAFTRAFGERCHWCEIDDGLDFLAEDFRARRWFPSVGDAEPTMPDRYDWIVTNPPWSLFRPFLKKSMEVANNVVFLATTNHWHLRARRRDMRAAGFGFVEIAEVETPPKPWPQSGFQLSAVHIRLGHKGKTAFTQLP